MSSSESNPTVTLEVLKEQLGKNANFFGYEEKIETGALSSTLWTIAYGGTGSVIYENGNVLLIRTGATAGSTCSFKTKRSFGPSSTLYNVAASSFKKLVLEFNLSILAADIATGFDSKTFFGFCYVNSNYRGDTHMYGITVDTGKVQRSAKAAGAESLLDLSAYWNNNSHLIRIEATNASISLYIDGILVETLTNATYIPVTMGTILFYVKNTPAANIDTRVQQIRAWMEAK